MGILSAFRKATPQEIYQEIASGIVVASLNYRSNCLEEENVKLSADAGAEYLYLLLHLVDRATFQILGGERRNVVFDEVAKIALPEYCKAVLRPTTPESTVLTLVHSLLDDMNDRQAIYSQCKSLAGDGFPGRGTMVFALAYFVHLALQRTSVKDVDDILCGKRELTRAENDDFPGADEILRLSIHVGASTRALRINDSLKKLR